MTKEDFYRRKNWLLGVAVASGAIMVYFFEEVYGGFNIISFLFGLILFISFGLYTWVTWNDERGGGDGGF